MKYFLVLLITSAFLIILNSSTSPADHSKSEQPTCKKSKLKKQRKNPDKPEFFLLQPSPFHI